MKPIEITFDVTQKDMEACLPDYYFKTPLFRKHMLRIQILVPVVFCMMWVAYWCFTGKYVVELAIILLIATVLGVAFMPRGIKKDYLKNYRKQLASSGSQKAIGYYTYRFEDNEILGKGPLGESKWTWLGVEKVIPAKDYLHIIFSGDRVLPISRAQVPPETLQELQAAISEKLATQPATI